MLEMLLPEYTKQLLENYQSIYSQLASQLRWLYFDDAFRLVTRVGYLDDGYIRLRLDGHWEFTGELLRELSWLYYSVADMSRNIDMLKNALESVGLDKLRVVAEVTLGELNLTRVSGATLTARDWSQDFAKLQNLDVALSSRASESTLLEVRDRLPSSLTASGNFKVALLEDAVGVARESTLSAIKSKTDNLDVALSTRASEATLLAIRDRLPSSLTAAGNLKIAISEDAVGLAKEATLSALSGKFPSATSIPDTMPNPSTTVVGAALLGFDGTNWRRVAVDPNRRLRVVAESVANPSNLDVALSSRASESTLSSFSGKFPSATSLSDNLSNPSTTIVGSALLGWDGANWRRVVVDATSRLRVVAESVANPPNLDVALSSRASEATLSAIKSKTDNIDVALSSFVGTPGTGPPGRGVVLLGYDGQYLRLVRTTADGKLLAQLG
jgi:hypothetical protein